MANKFPLTVNTSTKVIEELSSGDNLNLSGSGIYDGASLGNTGDFLRKKSGGGVEWSSVAPGSIPVPVASETTLGGIKVGQNLSIDNSGVLSANLGCYTLPIASSTVLGGLKIGSGLTINPITGVVNATGYTLPVASSSTLGGVKVGSGLSITNDGTLNLNYINIPVATANVLGAVQIGSGLSVSNTGLLSVPIATTSSLGIIKVGANLIIDGGGVLSAVPYSLPIASATGLGGIKIGSGLSINGSTGVLSLSLPTASASVLGGVKVDGTTITITGDGIISSTTGGGTGLASRTETSITTASLANNTGADATFTGFKSYAILKINTSHAAWVTLYTDVASRTADASRLETTDPIPGSGVLAEVITTGSQTVILTPGTIGFNNDTSSPSTNVYAKIVNKSGSSTAITVTLTLLKLEV